MTDNLSAIQEIAPVAVDNHDKPHLTLVPSKITHGRDELNFAEFPLSALSEKSDPSIKTIFFEDKIFDRSKNQLIPRKVTITGSDAFGLPTPLDEEVLLAIIQLSKLQGFCSRRVHFTRHQLLQILNWAPNGQNYARLEQAFNRWMGVTIYYQGAWRDRQTQSWVDESFHMLERVKIFRDEYRGISPDHGTGGTSYFEWNEVVFRSFQNGNVKPLNYEFLLSIESSIAKRLYRFLNKRFYHGKHLEFELKALCYEHIGLSRNLLVADLKRKLLRAIAELEEKGFLTAMPKEERFRKDAPGLWKVLFTKANHATSRTEHDATTEVPVSLEGLLVEFGVREQKARELIAQFGEELVKSKLQVATWLKEKGDTSLISNPPGYLIAAIEKGFEDPKAFVDESRAAERKRSSDLAAKKIAAAEARRVERQEQESARRSKLVEEYLRTLTAQEREELVTKAITDTDSAKKRILGLGGKTSEALRTMIIENYVLEILAAG